VCRFELLNQVVGIFVFDCMVIFGYGGVQRYKDLVFNEPSGFVFDVVSCLVDVVKVIR
jgi:hypothetical protein